MRDGKMSKDTEVFIQGVGFKPNQELATIFTDANGATGDLETYQTLKRIFRMSPSRTL